MAKENYQTEEDIRYKKYLKYFNYVKEKPRLSFLQMKRKSRFDNILLISFLLMLFVLTYYEVVNYTSIIGLDLNDEILVVFFTTLILTAIKFGFWFLIFIIIIFFIERIIFSEEFKQLKEERKKIKQLINNEHKKQ